MHWLTLEFAVNIHTYSHYVSAGSSAVNKEVQWCVRA